LAFPGNEDHVIVHMTVIMSWHYLPRAPRKPSKTTKPACRNSTRETPLKERDKTDQIPEGLWPYFQEYDPTCLDLEGDADLIIQRALEFGTWDEVRWMFAMYGRRRIHAFLRKRGERLLSPVTFNYIGAGC